MSYTGNLLAIWNDEKTFLDNYLTCFRYLFYIAVDLSKLNSRMLILAQFYFNNCRSINCCEVSIFLYQQNSYKGDIHCYCYGLGNHHSLWDNHQKQSSISVLWKMCSENMQQIYRRTPIPKYDFTEVALQLYWNCTLAWVFSYKLATYFLNSLL